MAKSTNKKKDAVAKKNDAGPNTPDQPLAEKKKKTPPISPKTVQPAGPIDPREPL